MSGIKIKFDCNGFNAPAYSCSEPGDNSGYYVQSTDYDKLTQQVAELRAVVYEANKYLDINNPTTIGHGSNLHEWFKQALAETDKE